MFGQRPGGDYCVMVFWQLVYSFSFEIDEGMALYYLSYGLSEHHSVYGECATGGEFIFFGTVDYQGFAGFHFALENSDSTRFWHCATEGV